MKPKDTEKRIDEFRATFAHVSKRSGFMPDSPSQHACLDFGYWCFSNALENPLMFLRYLIRKVTR